MSTIQKHYQLPFPIARVYAAWVSSKTIIPPATDMDINPVVGGQYRLIMKTPEYSSTNEGRFLIVEPDHHVRYTWQWSGDDEITEIDVTFSTQIDGTAIDITHSGFQSETSRANHDSGWDSYIAGFEAHLQAGGDF
jgi:uncharacterized protein YndB with AHSA1/START domain